MYMAYSNTNQSHTPHRSVSTSRRMTNNVSTKAMIRFILLAVILGTVFSFGAIVQAYAGDGAPTTSVNAAPISKTSKVVVQDQIVIQCGDTLWDIASSHKRSDENIRSYMDKLKAINHLSSSTLKEGQVLLIP